MKEIEGILNELEKLEKQYSLVKEKFKKLMEQASEGIVIIQSGIIKYANQSFAELVGYTLEEINDTPFIEYVHYDEVIKLVKRYKRRMAGEDVIPIYKTMLIDRNGNKVDVEINARIITYHEEPADFVIIKAIKNR